MALARAWMAGFTATGLESFRDRADLCFTRAEKLVGSPAPTQFGDA